MFKSDFDEVAKVVVEKLDGLVFDLDGSEKVLTEDGSFSLLDIAGKTGSLRLLFFKLGKSELLAHVIVRIQVASQSGRTITYEIGHEELEALFDRSKVNIVDSRRAGQFITEFSRSDIELRRAA